VENGGGGVGGLEREGEREDGEGKVGWRAKWRKGNGKGGRGGGGVRGRGEGEGGERWGSCGRVRAGRGR
jgi:hypothetical protein